MAGIGGAVAVAAGASPRTFLRPFGIAPREVTGAAAFGWRLFAVRTAWLSALAWRGDETARGAFAPVQLLDQIVFWHGYASGAIPRRAAGLAATASGAIVALDVVRRAAQE
jgi:hypothetical protein